jgi:hypothetical protein
VPRSNSRKNPYSCRPRRTSPVPVWPQAPVSTSGCVAPLHEGSLTLSRRGQCDRGKDSIGAKRVGEIGEQRPARPYPRLWTATGEAVVPHRGRKRQAHIPSQHAQPFDGHLDELAPTLQRNPQFVRVNHTRQSTPHKFCALRPGPPDRPTKDVGQRPIGQKKVAAEDVQHDAFARRQTPLADGGRNLRRVDRTRHADPWPALAFEVTTRQPS